MIKLLATTWSYLSGKTKEGNWDTVGPALDEHPPVPVKTLFGVERQGFTAGWWAGATKKPAHPKRLGRAITPQSITVHATDMMPNTFDGLVKRWTKEAGLGNAAHFLIGRTPEQGVIQFASILVNANHAGGGNGHGWFRTKEGRLIHPNTCSVGIEIHSAGLLKRTSAGWVHKDSGHVVPDKDVYIDDKGKGWMKMTEYQHKAMDALLSDLLRVLTPFPQGTTIVPNGTYAGNGVYPWAQVPPNQLDIVGHVTLDPTNKTDPGPQGMAWVREW